MKNFFVRILVALLVSPGLCFAQAQPTAMQRAVSSLIQTKSIQRGFAANDPRIAATLQAGTSAVIGAAAAAAVVTAAGITAPAWITAAVVVGLGAVFSYGVSLAIDATVAWLFNSDGSISAITNPIDKTEKAMVAGGPYWSFNGYKTAGDPWTLMRAIVSAPGGYSPDADNIYKLRDCKQTSATMAECRVQLTHPQDTPSCNAFCQNPSNWGYVSIQRMEQGAPGSCAAGKFFNGGACRELSAEVKDSISGEVGPAKSVTDAVAQLTPEQKSMPLNPAVLAAIADRIWQKASQQAGYQGVPYDAANPITATDAAAYQTANPSTYPTVQDAVAPQPGDSSNPAASAWSLAVPSSTPGTGTGGSTTQPTQPTIDWAITGDGGSIPKQAVSVSYTPTLFAAPTGCPAPITFGMFGKSFSIGYGPFCDLMTTLAPIFLACGAAAAALIFAESLKS